LQVERKVIDKLKVRHKMGRISIGLYIQRSDLLRSALGNSGTVQGSMD